jgi:hypothetical protein
LDETRVVSAVLAVVCVVIIIWRRKTAKRKNASPDDF